MNYQAWGHLELQQELTKRDNEQQKQLKELRNQLKRAEFNITKHEKTGDKIKTNYWEGYVSATSDAIKKLTN